MRIKENQLGSIFCRQDPLNNVEINKSNFNENDIFLVTQTINHVVILYVHIFCYSSICYIGFSSLSLKCEIDLAICFYWKEYKF